GAGTDALSRGALKFNGRVEIVAGNALRPGNVPERDDGTERDDRTIGAAHLELSDRGLVEAVLRVRLSCDPVGAAKSVKVVHIGRAEIDTKRVEDVLQGNVKNLRAH